MTDTTDTESPSNAGLFTNATSLLVGRFAIAVMGWAATVLVVRTLGTEDFGRFSLVFSILGMTSIVTELGLGRVAIAGVLDDDADPESFAGTYVVLRLLLGVVGYFAALAVVFAAGYEADVVKATAIAGIVVLIATPSNAYNLAFQAHLKMSMVAVAEVLGQLALLAVTTALAVSGGGLLWFMVPAVVSELVIVALKIRPARALIAFRYSIRPTVWAALLREAIPLSIGGAVVTLYSRVDAVMLSQMDTFTAVGQYGVAAKFADVARFVATSLSVPILTVFVRSWPHDQARFRQAIGDGMSFLGFFVGGLICSLVVFADEVVPFLYGADFSAAGDATRLLVVGACITFFSSLAFNVLIAADRRLAYPVAAVIGLLANIGLNLVLIPRFSFDGAAVATVLTNAVVVAVIWSQVRRLGRFRPDNLTRLTMLIPATAAGVLVGVTLDQLVAWPVAGLAGGLVYVAGVELTGALGPGGLRGLVRSRPQ